MSYAAAALAGRAPPKKEDMVQVLAHFSHYSFKPEDLISQVERISKIKPVGNRSHARGALLAFASNEELSTVLEKSQGSLVVKKVHVAFTTLSIAVPAKERGRRWRISGVPF